ncbi:endolytic transglycosylase MltG [Candidatus Falkowbacteria bacterium]|nr:endolytic transglycosylase MltG [Candidatus Falkowbacteria bacterium]
MVKKIIIIIAVIALSGFLYWQNLNSPVDANGQEQVFLVSKGEAINRVAKNLRINNLIRSEFYFKYKIGRDNNVKAGEYLISPKLSAKEIIKILTLGDAVSREKSIRIIEGWNNKDIGAYLEKNKIVSVKDLTALAASPLNRWNFNFTKPNFLNDAPEEATLEGYLFPDTYRVFNNTKAEEIILKMLNNFDVKLTPEIRAEIKRQKKTIYEIITMASIVEKEVRSTADMKIVSGIFWDRIKNNQGLEYCATLAYVLGVNKAQYSFEDTRVASPYNTYKYRGLPPGPIANPGFNAISAAVYPEATDYNYFLSDPATGKTIYSRTLDEHNANKYKYLK